MVQLDFELPAALASMLRKQDQNQQKRIDDIVDFALLIHLSTVPRSVEIGVSRYPDLATRPLSKRKAGVAKPDVDPDALFKTALQKYFLRDHATGKTFRAIFQRLTPVRAGATNA
ncbi:MAG: hypothetical protein M3Z14_02205 [Candidatus Eremiobacteraeota bacterium]|nr:hypothetical protein [Candidatus Eremiobacteraeota bacterium]